MERAAGRCGGEFEGALVLFHGCDEFMHAPGLSAVPGVFHPGESVSRLCALVPEARARRTADLSFSFYLGAKIDHPSGGNRRHVDDCGLANLRLAWPGVWSLATINAREIVDDLLASAQHDHLLDGDRPPLDPAAAGLATGAATGSELRLAPTRPWHDWPAFRALHRIA